MKCIACNSEIQGPGYCPVCGSYNGSVQGQQMIPQMSQMTPSAMNQMPQQQMTGNVAMGMNPQPYPPKEKKPMNKKVVIGILCGILAVAATVVAILILTGGAKKINLNDYLRVEIAGEYNGCATATYTFDTDKFARDNENIKYTGDRSSYGVEGQATYDLLAELGTYDYEIGYFEKAEGLSNGEKAHFYWKIDKAYIEKNFKVELEFEDIEKDVSGLKDAEEFDPFDENLISVYFTGIEPNGEVHVDVKNGNPYKSVLQYSCDKKSGLSDGEKVVLTINGNESDIRRKCAEIFGKIPATTSKEYTAEIGHYATTASEIPKETYEAIDKQTQDELKAASVNWEKGKSYIGSRPIGSYFMKSKSEKNATRNILYRLYLVESSNYSVFNDSFEYYYCVKYENVVIKKDGKCDLNVMEGEYNPSLGHSFKVGKYEYGGDPTEDAFEAEFITPLLDEYESAKELDEYSGDKLIDKCTMVTDLLDKEVTDEKTGHRYKVVYADGYIDFDAVENRCEAEGGHLVTLNSDEEFAFVKKLFDPSYDSCALGGEYIDGKWCWVTGEPYEKQFYPNYEVDLNYLILLNNELSCTNDWIIMHYYICEWDQ